jgi:YD repeat-containing protein
MPISAGETISSDEGAACAVPGCESASILLDQRPAQDLDVTIDYVYDPLQRLVEANYSDGTYYHYTYDANGNQKKVETHLGKIEYDMPWDSLIGSSYQNYPTPRTQAYDWDDNPRKTIGGEAAACSRTGRRLMHTIPPTG